MNYFGITQTGLNNITQTGLFKLDYSNWTIQTGLFKLYDPKFP
jgi:hypothetical protein